MKSKFIKTVVLSILTTQLITIGVQAKTINNDKGSIGKKELQKIHNNEELELNEKKEKVAKSYMEYLDGEISKDELLQKCNELGINETIKNVMDVAKTKEELLMKQREVSIDNTDEKVKEINALRNEKARGGNGTEGMIWELKQYPQERGYWCGPAAANVTELQGKGYRLPGHPDGNREHWIAIDSYYNNGNTIGYAESVYGAPSVGWYQNAGVKKYNQVPASHLSWLIWERGLVW